MPELDTTNPESVFRFAQADYTTDPGKKPYRCPVCGGNGLVPNGFYLQTSGDWATSSITPEQCRTCEGKGIVWT